MNVLSWAVGYFVAIVFAVYQGYEYGRQNVQAKWDTEKAATVIAQREKETELQSSMDKLRTEKNRELARLNTTVRRLSDSLRSRPERPTMPTSASAGDAGGWCSGTGLYKSDGEFLIGEAARAAATRLALINCQKAYQAAVDKSAGH